MPGPVGLSAQPGLTQDAPAAPPGADSTRRNVLVLAGCQALGMTGQALVGTVAALAGYNLAPDKSWATLPQALMVTGTMLSTIPASLLMNRIGRRPGFTLGAAIGALGAGLCGAAIALGSFALFSLGAILLGAFNAFIGFYRFAAADTAGPEDRARAISLVLAGGVLAALCGPQLAKWSRPLFEPLQFAGSFGVVLLLAAGSAALLQWLRIPRPVAVGPAGGGRPTGVILRQPLFIVAVIASASGYAVMTLVMTATPLAMIGCGFAFDQAASVIQWHILAMTAPSFVTGSLIRWFGVLRIILVGALLNVGVLAADLSGITFAHFWVGLVLLGLGWNFMFIGGTTLLGRCHTAAERGRIQAAHDFILFALMALASFASGYLQDHFGWAAVNLGVIPLVVLGLAVAAWAAAHRLDRETVPAAA